MVRVHDTSSVGRDDDRGELSSGVAASELRCREGDRAEPLRPRFDRRTSNPTAPRPPITSVLQETRTGRKRDTNSRLFYGRPLSVAWLPTRISLIESNPPTPFRGPAAGFQPARLGAGGTPLAGFLPESFSPLSRLGGASQRVMIMVNDAGKRADPW